jgi:hypothetical protein
VERVQVDGGHEPSAVAEVVVHERPRDACRFGDLLERDLDRVGLGEHPHGGLDDLTASQLGIEPCPRFLR